MAAEADGAQLQGRVERCVAVVEAKGSDFVPRSYLLPPLQALRSLLSASDGSLLEALAELRQRGPGGSPLLTALGDTVNACLLLLTALEDDGVVGAVPRSQAEIWVLGALRAQALRLRALEAPLRELAAGPGPPTGEPPWDAPSILAGGSLEGLWRRHFGRAAVAPVSELLEAILDSCEVLGPEEQQELRAWLRPDRAGDVNVAEVAVALGGDGLWRGALLCADWVELCPRALLRVIHADGKAGSGQAPEAAPWEAVPQEQQGVLVLLPGWSRERLRSERAALHVLRALGLRLFTDAAAGGLLVRLPTGHILQSQSLHYVIHELIGQELLPCQPAEPAQLEACIAEVVARRLQLAGQRGQHVALSQVHRRALPWLQDDAEDLLSFQRQLLDLLRERLEASTGEAPPALEPSVVEEGPGRPSLRELVQEGRELAEQAQACRTAWVQEEMRRNAEGQEDDEPELLLARLDADAAFVEHERLLLEETELCARRQDATRTELLLMEEALVGLETTFAISRREMLQRDGELSKQIDEAEAELAALAASLSGAREASRAKEDEVREARQELAEQMVLASPGEENEALETQLLAEVQALRARSEELHRKLARAKASTKKR